MTVSNPRSLDFPREKRLRDKGVVLALGHCFVRLQLPLRFSLQSSLVHVHVKWVLMISLYCLNRRLCRNRLRAVVMLDLRVSLNGLSCSSDVPPESLCETSLRTPLLAQCTRLACLAWQRRSMLMIAFQRSNVSSCLTLLNSIHSARHASTDT
jgi:hypothetical protein